MKEKIVHTEHGTGFYWLSDKWDAPCHGKFRPYNEFSFEDTTKVILQIMNENHVENIVGIGISPYGEIYYSKSDIFWLKQVEWMGMCYPINPLKKVAAKGATCTDVGYNNMMDMIISYSKKEYCHLMQIAYNALIKDNRNLEIACPVLIIYGEHDRTGKVRQYCRRWHEQTYYPLVAIKNAGNNANVDNPKEMNRIIEAFLKEVVDEED